MVGGAMTKTLEERKPKRIWLQWNPEGERPETVDVELDGMTW
jgi:hypothetical protein